MTFNDGADAGCVAGFLDVHSEVDSIHEDLNVGLGLQSAAHHTETHHWPSILHYECRDDRVERAFARCVDVGVPLLERK